MGLALVEINAAFGAQVMACARMLGLDEARLNGNGGARCGIAPFLENPQGHA